MCNTLVRALTEHRRAGGAEHHLGTLLLNPAGTSSYARVNPERWERYGRSGIVALGDTPKRPRRRPHAPPRRLDSGGHDACARRDARTGYGILTASIEGIMMLS